MTVREPPLVPSGIKLINLPQGMNSQFRYQMVLRKAADIEATITALKKESQTFTTRIRQRKGLAARYFANPSGKSFSITLLGAIIGAVVMFNAVIFFPNILIEYTEEYVFPLGEKFKTTAVETYQGFFGDGEDEATESIRDTTQ